MSDSLQDSQLYEQKSPIKDAYKAALIGGGIGLFFSAVQNALTKHSYGAMGVFTRTGGTIGFVAAMGATFAFTEGSVANYRRTTDAVNGAAGGCVAGFLAGVRARSIPGAIVGCAVLGTAIGGYDYSGKLAGEREETKEERRKRFFKQPKTVEEPSE